MRDHLTVADDRPSEVLGALPRTRPHRRSDKRAARPVTEATETQAPAEASGAKPTAAKPRAATKPKPRAATKPKPRAATKPKLRQPAQPGGTPAARRAAPAPARKPDSARGDILGTAVQAAAELAEIGLAISARALRGAVSRLPRP